MNYQGLTHDQIIKKQQEFGPNEIRELNKVSLFGILFRQVKKNFVVYLLAVAAVISFAVGKPVTAYTILAVVAAVILVGFIQEFKAEKSISALKSLILPLSRVIREGKEKQIPSSEIVPGDILVLRNGERIPADCVLIDQKEIRVNESVLTGESMEVKKTAAQDLEKLTDDNLLFMGTFIVNGKAVAQVLYTGMDTKFGKIAGMISTVEKSLPLQDKVNKISKYMVLVAITVSFATGLLMFLRADTITTDVLINILILVIALSVSAFPEGFPVVLITTLASGASRMAKQNAIVNRMSIIETLGEATVICTDKTGTITEGEMTVRKIYVDGQIIDVAGKGRESKGLFLTGGQDVNLKNHQPFQILLKAALICNDSVIEKVTGSDMLTLSGSQTESSLLVMAAKAGVYKEDISYKRQEEVPFSSARKLMSVLSSEDEGRFVYVKGAPEVVLENSSYLMKSGKKITLDKKTIQQILETNHRLTSKSYRTLAFAYKMVISKSKKYTEDGLVFLGIVGMEDPPREEVAEAIILAIRAGIDVKMITGDNKQTALAIASQVGLKGEVLEGYEIDGISDQELARVVKDTNIFVRVKPEHKLRIVRALKANGEIVAMTGDGVNDAPALKEAHIGIAMGKNGTDVSRSVADLLLKDDNFATIVSAIKEGRTIFSNVRKFSSYQLSCNLAELFIIFMGVLLAPLLGWEVPLLLALQILFMNLVTDNLPAITLGFNPSSKDVMEQHPRKKAEILDQGTVPLIIFIGVFLGLLTLTSYYLAFNIFHLSTEASRTVALVTLILLEIFGAFCFRSFRQLVLNRSLFTNKYLVGASFLSIILTLIIVYTPMNTVFETSQVAIVYWIIPILLAVFLVVVIDILKTINNKTGFLNLRS